MGGKGIGGKGNIGEFLNNLPQNVRDEIFFKKIREENAKIDQIVCPACGSITMIETKIKAAQIVTYSPILSMPGGGSATKGEGKQELRSTTIVRIYTCGICGKEARQIVAPGAKELINEWKEKTKQRGSANVEAPNDSSGKG